MRTRIFWIIFTLLKISLLSGAYAQTAVTTLHENFDVACVYTTGFATNWMSFNPIASTSPQGAWTCNPQDGNFGTPGMECTGVWSADFHLDTSYLITPKLDLSGYTDSVFLRFDLKTTKVYLGAKLSVVHTDNPPPFSDTTHFDSTHTYSEMTPAISTNDSSNWVTHQINITALKTMTPLYLTFMYTSPATSGSIWYLDNVEITTSSMVDIHNIPNQYMPLTVIGNSKKNEINIAFSTPSLATCDLSIFDMLGKCVHSEKINSSAGEQHYAIHGLDLQSGLYCIKLGNEYNYGVAKVMIP